MQTPERVSFSEPQYINLNGFDIFIKNKIGNGGFGSVYLAEYEYHAYALKIYRMWEVFPGEREDFLKRIYQEFEISDAIDSPYVVKILTCQELKGNPVLIMEFCEGGSLREFIGEYFPDSKILQIIKDVSKGLMAMHGKGVVHRDIKPENILIKDRNFCVSDFGISVNLQNRLTKRDIRGRVKQIFATAAYSPPEQVNGSIAYKSTAATNDIYSLGVLLYEILSKGQLPFGSVEQYMEDPLFYEEKKKKGNWNWQSLENIPVNPLWKKIIEKCLKPSPSERFQDLNEILLLLESSNEPEFLPKPPNLGGWKLRLVEGIQEGLIFYIDNLSKSKTKLTIGRSGEGPDEEENDIILRESGKILISRHHATLEKSSNPQGDLQWAIRDGQWVQANGKASWHLSRNGVFVNKEKINQAGVSLQAGDLISIGSTCLKVETADEDFFDNFSPQ